MNQADQIERLDKIYYCNDCKLVFLFQSDIEDHGLFVGHDDFTALPFEWLPSLTRPQGGFQARNEQAVVGLAAISSNADII